MLRLGHSGTWDSVDSCRSDSCNGTADMAHSKRVGRQEPRCDTARCPAWHEDERQACGRRIWLGTLRRGGERCQQALPSQITEDAVDGYQSRLPSSSIGDKLAWSIVRCTQGPAVRCCAERLVQQWHAGDLASLRSPSA